MWRSLIPPWRPAASLHAGDVDLLFVGLLLTSLLAVLVLFGLLLAFAIRYRAGNDVERGDRERKSWRWEIGWSLATLVVFLGLFVWGTSLFFDLYQPPQNAIPIFVVAKQWMWKA